MSDSKQPEPPKNVPFRRVPAIAKVSVEDDTSTGRKMLGAEYAEHGRLGDLINLTWTDGQKYKAKTKPFTLPSGVIATYGQINGLAGDFYGTYNPISDGTDLEDQIKRFEAAYATLADPSDRQPAEANNLLAILQTEVDAVSKALDKKEDPSIAYSKLDSTVIELELEAATVGRHGTPGYLGLSTINFDHFGKDGHTAYVAGHTAALRMAHSGDLLTAYQINAFADHFLEDAFSSGHMRTPRRGLHSNYDNPFWDLDAKLMHDEDCALGLSVTNKRGDQKWTAYGDKRMFDKEDDTNKTNCRAAVQASADEVYAVWQNRNNNSPIPKPEDYAFQELAPIVEDNQDLAALFIMNGGTLQIRSDLKDRRTPKWRDLGYLETAVEIWTKAQISGWWNYKMTLDGGGK